MRWAAIILAIGIVLVVLTPSNAWWRSRRRWTVTGRRRRSCYPVNCRVSAWSTWSTCTQSCGLGLTTRTRTKTTTESCGGSCYYRLNEANSCSIQCCPFDCVYAWSAWSKCATCGNSTQYRTPNVIIQSSCNGTACPVNETRSCNTSV